MVTISMRTTLAAIALAAFALSGNAAFAGEMKVPTTVADQER